MLEGGSKKSLNKAPMVSIITIVYNGCEYIERTIRSIINQTYYDFEFIIIDGGSTDGTLDIIRSFDSKIDYWISEKDAGIYDAVNKGAKLAKGKWLNFMNSSDVFFDDKVIDSIFKDGFSDDIKVLYSDWYICNSLLNPSNLKAKKASWFNGDILHQSIFYQKELHEKHGLYMVTKKKIIADYMFFSLIPENFVLKVNTPISINDINGVSYGSWSTEQKNMVDYMFEKISFSTLILKLCWIHTKKTIKIVINMIRKIK